jgi:hypothetical protein
MATEKSTLLLEVNESHYDGRLPQPCQDRLRGWTCDRVALDLVDECRVDLVVDFLAKTQKSRPLGTPSQRPR